MKTYKTAAIAKTQATIKTKRTNVEHGVVEFNGEFLMGTLEEIEVHNDGLACAADEAKAAALAAVAAAEAAEATAKAAAQQAMAELVEEVAAPKKASGWMKASVEYIKSVADLTDAAIGFHQRGKKFWVTVNNKEVFWVFKAERAEQLVAKLTAA